MRIFLLLIFILSTLFKIQCYAQAMGYLVAIGGGKRPDYIMKKIIDLAGGKEAKILVIPNASSEPLESAQRQVNEFLEMGAKADYLLFNAETADADSNLEKMINANAIFFSGGDQSNITRDLLRTKLLDMIYQIYKNGGVISGTSAGAAVMSKLMITGNELINSDTANAFISIQKNNVEVKEGLGFLESAIVDQHFIKRKRHNRLLSLVLEYPDLLGIGIDEETAVIVYPYDIIEVLGERQVIIFDAAANSILKANKNGYLTGSIKTYILGNGDKFSLKNKELVP